MAADHPISSAASIAIAPLIDLLQGELASHGMDADLAAPGTLQDFVAWYVEVIQRLEGAVAGSAGRQPITRTEVELMCRCALTAPDLRAAMEVCQSFSTALHPRAGRLALTQRGDRAVFRLDSLRAEPGSTSSLCDIAGLFAFYQLFHWLAGANLTLLQVEIGPIQRADVLPFLKLFRAPVLAGGRDYALELPAAALALPVVRTPHEFPGFFAAYPCGFFYGEGPAFVDQVAALLGAAARQQGRLPSQAELARGLGVSLSTFRRRLAAGGRSYRQLREASLCDQAELLLHNGRPIADIAAHLGFSDAAAFRRAFHQWHGCAPSDWRRRNTGR